MNPKQANYLIITITFCLAFLMWGSVFVLRSVTDRNYHTPAPLSATQQRIKDYESCASNQSTNNKDCQSLVNGGK